MSKVGVVQVPAFWDSEMALVRMAAAEQAESMGGVLSDADPARLTRDDDAVVVIDGEVVPLLDEADRLPENMVVWRFEVVERGT